MSNTANADIRSAAKRAGVCLWQIAERIGVNDGNFSRKLRRELQDQEKREILKIIDDLAAERMEAS